MRTRHFSGFLIKSGAQRGSVEIEARLYDWRSARPDPSTQALKGDFRLGTFRYICNEQNSLRMRMQRSVKDFSKSIPTRVFVDRAAPHLFEEPPGQPMSDAENVGSTGNAVQLSRVLGPSALSTVSYDWCQLRVFPDATLSFRVQFSGTGLPLDELVDLISTLYESTRRCVVEKLSAVVKDLIFHYPGLSDLKLSLTHPADPVLLQATAAPFLTSHRILIIEALRNPTAQFSRPPTPQ